MITKHQPPPNPDLPPRREGRTIVRWLGFLWDFQPRAVSIVSWQYGFFTCYAVTEFTNLIRYRDQGIIPSFAAGLVALVIAKWFHARHPLGIGD